METSDIDDAKLYALIGARLAQQRLANERSQAWMAKQIGMLRTSITNIERGHQKTPIHVIYGLCDALNIDPRELLPALSEVRKTSIEELTSGEEWLATDAPVAAEFLRRVMDDNTESDL